MLYISLYVCLDFCGVLENTRKKEILILNLLWLTQAKAPLGSTVFNYRYLNEAKYSGSSSILTGVPGCDSHSISLGLKVAPFDPTNERFVRSQHFVSYHEDEEDDSSLAEAAKRAMC